MKKQKIADFLLRRAKEELEEIPEIVVQAFNAVSTYEDTFGAAATLKLIEVTCTQELQRSKEDHGYSAFLMKMVHEVKELHGKKLN